MKMLFMHVIFVIIKHHCLGPKYILDTAYWGKDCSIRTGIIG